MALMQLVATGAKDILLNGNPQCGVPLYGYSEGRTLNSTPACSLEFSWIEESTEDKKDKIDYTTFFTSEYTAGDREPVVVEYKYYGAGENVEIITPRLDKNYEKYKPIIMRRKKIKDTEFIPNDDPFQTISTVAETYVKRCQPKSQSEYSQILEKFKNDRDIPLY